MIYDSTYAYYVCMALIKQDSAVAAISEGKAEAARLRVGNPALTSGNPLPTSAFQTLLYSSLQKVAGRWFLSHLQRFFETAFTSSLASGANF